MSNDFSGGARGGALWGEQQARGDACGEKEERKRLVACCAVLCLRALTFSHLLLQLFERIGHDLPPWRELDLA